MRLFPRILTVLLWWVALTSLQTQAEYASLLERMIAPTIAFVMTYALWLERERK